MAYELEPARELARHRGALPKSRRRWLLVRVVALRCEGHVEFAPSGPDNAPLCTVAPHVAPLAHPLS